jgi:hypothetical protein
MRVVDAGRGIKADSLDEYEGKAEAWEKAAQTYWDTYDPQPMSTDELKTMREALAIDEFERSER